MAGDYDNNKYSEYTDEELIDRYRNGETVIIDYLMIKYKNLVLSKTKSLYLLGGETEDLIQEGMIGLFQAVNDYDFGRDASFFTFADLCVTRKIYNAIKASNEKKHSFLNNYVSLNSPVEGENNAEGLALLERLANADDSEPETMALIGELKEEVVAAINKELTDLERENFLLYLTGMTNSEVARVVGRSPKETDNAIQRAKVKLRKIIKSR
ncbi:MAG: sigma-70 family RNA polymerase sigma factor [Lachnospiraceae bacterium]|nr:sigma-70 family RNA polymerase sigma factor [Lachnospiraceae bacterium]